MMSNCSTFMDCPLQSFSFYYKNIHRPLIAVISVIGICGQSLNISRLKLSPINSFLAAVSTAQLSLLLGNLLLLIRHYYMAACNRTCNHLQCCTCYTPISAWGEWILVGSNGVSHTTALLLLLYMTIYRVAALWRPLRCRNFLLNEKHARHSIFVIFMFVFVTSLPVFYSSHLVTCYEDLCFWKSGSEPEQEKQANWTELLAGGWSYNDTAGSQWHLPPGFVQTDLKFCTLALNTDRPGILLASYWIFGVCFKLLPSFLMLITSIFLILLIRVLEKQKKRLTRRTKSVKLCSSVINNRTSASPVNGHRTSVATGMAIVLHQHSTCCHASTKLLPQRVQRVSIKRGRRHVRPRTTRMLIAVALFCVAVEVPHGLLNLLVAQYGTWFVETVYNYLIEFIEMLTLLYSSINFVLFCIMNPDFLDALRHSYAHRKRRLANFLYNIADTYGDHET